ncbi:hypothetical protein [Streptomyces sp. DSM 40907]|uniref:hypothetical protein n=1 Tax=Streptomyces kutzneri TaxID=3051179 RepID=UPI0028D7B90D|nr:hypothetical protein [Streptomyces sp. DSM 40907]
MRPSGPTVAGHGRGRGTRPQPARDRAGQGRGASRATAVSRGRGSADGARPADGLPGSGPHGGAGGTATQHNGADTTDQRGGSAFTAHGSFVRGGSAGGGGASLFGTADTNLAAAPGGVGGRWRPHFFTDGEKGGAAGTCPGLAEEQEPEVAQAGEGGGKDDSGGLHQPGRGGAGGGELPASWTAGTGGKAGYRGIPGATGSDGKAVISLLTD